MRSAWNFRDLDRVRTVVSKAPHKPPLRLPPGPPPAIEVDDREAGEIETLRITHWTDIGALLPDQRWPFDPIAEDVSPERRLMAAVLWDAMLCLAKYRRCPNPGARHRAYEVRRWLATDTRSYPFSFASICDVLGVDVASCRQAIRHWSESTVTPRRLTRIAASASRSRVVAQR